jgi:DNA-binding beta-propeller fold protein YncE
LLASLPLTLLAEDTKVDEDPLFYPLPPNQPRLQYLTKYSSIFDISAKSGGFRNFVFGGEDKESHLVTKPYGLAVHQGAIYVVDTRGNGYAIFDFANGRSKVVTPTGAGSLIKPINIAIDDDGTRYITDTGRGQVLVFDASDRYLRSLGEKGQFRPADVAIAGDRLYVTDVENHKVHAIDKLSGASILSFGEPGSREGQFFHPTNLAIAGDGSIYVVDQSNFRLQQFSPTGEFIRSVGEIGSAPGKFARPKGIALDKEDRIYVVDAAFQNVQIFAPEGGALMYFGGPGEGRGQLSLPSVVKIDYANVPFFEKYAAPNFDIEYLVVVASQFGPNKVVVYGFGSLRE